MATSVTSRGVKLGFPFGGGQGCTVRSNASLVMVNSVNRMKDRHDRKHYLPETSLARDNHWKLTAFNCT